jgi:hypothetical protein
MEGQKELALNVELITINNQDKNHTVLEEFLTNELHRIIPEINSNINWNDVKNKLGNELIINSCPKLKEKYLLSLGINVLLIGGLFASKLYSIYRK